MPPTKIQENWPFGSGEEFSRWQSRRPAWISYRNDLSYFLISKSPRCFLQCFKSIGLSVQEKKRRIGFQDGHHGGHFGFPIGTILAIFDLQKSKRKVQGVPQSQTAALPRSQEEEETDKSKQAQTEQTSEKH